VFGVKKLLIKIHKTMNLKSSFSTKSGDFESNVETLGTLKEFLKAHFPKMKKVTLKKTEKSLWLSDNEFIVIGSKHRDKTPELDWVIVQCFTKEGEEITRLIPSNIGEELEFIL